MTNTTNTNNTTTALNNTDKLSHAAEVGVRYLHALEKVNTLRSALNRAETELAEAVLWSEKLEEGAKCKDIEDQLEYALINLESWAAHFKLRASEII